jgi:predicted SprT family Zn-dependent metalloprotease
MGLWIFLTLIFLTLMLLVLYFLKQNSSPSKINNVYLKNKITYPKRVKKHSRMESFDLVRIFMDWNLREFNGELPVPELRWNSKLRSSAGRFIPARPRPIIEIATYLCDEDQAEHFIKDTMGHELIHYWLWHKKKPYGHTPLFYEIMNRLGVSRYNTVPKHRPYKHCYACDQCGQKIWVRRRLPQAACASCCNQFAQGRYHAQFNLRLEITGIAAAMAQKKVTK